MTTVRVITQRAARAASRTAETLLLTLWTVLVLLSGIAAGFAMAVVRQCG